VDIKRAGSQPSRKGPTEYFVGVVRIFEEIRPGDVIWFPPAEKHWHGAAPTTAVTHIAIQEQLEGKTVDWLEKVTDEQYQTESKAGEARSSRTCSERPFVRASI